jgi:hypothetical protein
MMRLLAITVLVACNVPDEHFSKSAQNDAGTLDGAPTDGAPTATATLTVTTTGDGIVASSDGKIVCGARCSADFPTTATVTLDATAGAGSTFAGWSGACANASGPCTVTMDAARSVKATFYYSLQIATGGGTVDIAPSNGLSCTPAQGFDACVAFAPNVVVTLTPSASVGHSFTAWSGGTCTGAGACTVVLAAPVSVVATFTVNQHTMTETVSAQNPGTNAILSAYDGSTCFAACTPTVPFGTSVTLTASPDPSNGRFIRWMSGPCAGSTTPTCSFAMPDADVQAVASFDWFARLTIAANGAASPLASHMMSSPTGIDCYTGPPESGTCTMGFARGAATTLTMYPGGKGWQNCTLAMGTIVGQWSGACSGTLSTCSLTFSSPGDYSAESDITCQPI